MRWYNSSGADKYDHPTVPHPSDWREKYGEMRKRLLVEYQEKLRRLLGSE